MPMLPGPAGLPDSPGFHRGGRMFPLIGDGVPLIGTLATEGIGVETALFDCVSAGASLSMMPIIAYCLVLRLIESLPRYRSLVHPFMRLASISCPTFVLRGFFLASVWCRECSTWNIVAASFHWLLKVR